MTSKRISEHQIATVAMVLQGAMSIDEIRKRLSMGLPDEEEKDRERLLTYKETEAMLALSRQMLWQMTKGDSPALNIVRPTPGAVRFRLSEVMSIVNGATD